MLWINLLDHGGSEPGAGPVGPGPGRELLLLGIGRAILLGLSLDMLRQVLMG